MTRLEQFRVQRYGHFTDLEIEFGPGCTVVYGENEAGKSTLLDALGDFLWGFPTRNHPREFVFKRNQMLIEATIDEQPNRLYARQATKFTCDGEALAEAPWSVDLNRKHWDHAYGLNLERLERGGHEVISGRDDPGGISFLADTGLPIDEVMERLTKRQREIFAAHGNAKNAAIQQLLARLNEIDKRIEEVGASAQDVDMLQTRLAELTTALGQSEGLLASLDDQIAVIRQLLGALDNVSHLEKLDADLAELGGDEQVLSKEDTDDLQAALDELDDIDANVDALTKARDNDTRRLEGLTPRDDVLERTADIRAVMREDEARRTDAKTLTDTSAAATYRQQVVNLLDALGQDSDDLQAARRKVSLPTDRLDQLNRLAEAWDKATAALEAQRQEVRDAKARLHDESAPVDGSDTLVRFLSQRDEAWNAIRQPWISGDLPDDTERVELATRLDAAIEGADAEAERAAAALEQLGVSRGKRQEAERALARENEQLAKAEAAETSAGASWARFVSDSGLPKGLDPTAWRTRAELLTQLTNAWQKWQDQQARHEEARQRFDDYQVRVAELALLLDNPSGDALTDADALQGLLDTAEETQTQQRSIQDTIEAANSALATAATTREEIVTRVAELAGDEDPRELLERSSNYHQLRDRRAAVVKLIDAATPDIPTVDEVITHLDGRDRAALQAEEKRLTSERVALDAARNADVKAVGATQGELSNLKHKEGTAALLAERQEVCARITELAERYRNLHVQELILHEYAKLNADRSDTPILDRAGAYLKTLTSGRHQGFAIETIGTDKHLRIQSLVGDTIQETEPSKLSDGTEHQVYFALRLAGIAARQAERQRKGQPTVPVVFDDVFQAFDDERSATALELLAKLGEQFQIIVMTHERSIYNIAETLPEVRTVRLTAPQKPVAV